MKKESERKLYTLNTANLKRGDTIITTSKDRLSNAIRFITFGPFSHAMLYLGGDSCSDAGGPGTRVSSHNTQRIFFASPKHCSVFRLKNELQEAEMDRVINYARSIIGMEYSLPEASLVILRVNFTAKEINRQFCSRYVAQSYENANITLVKNPDYCSPVDILKSSLIEIVPDYLRVASKQEIEIFGKESIPLTARDYADEYMYSNAKKLTGYDIQTDEQFNAVVIMLPQFDTNFCDFLIDSGYLNLWEIEMKENPEIYDYNLLKIKCNDVNYLRWLGLKNFKRESDLRKGWDITLNTLNNSFYIHPLQTLKLQIDLYEKLIDLSFKREEVWRLASIEDEL